jgi:hypothetical protein
MKRALNLFVILTGLLAGVAGCLSNDPTVGYTTQNQYRGGIRSVTVPIWTRGADVYRRDLEIRLTKALVTRIELSTPYKVTAKDRADTILTGSIDRITQTVLSMNPDTARPRETQATFYVSFEWKDLRSGEILIKKNNYRVAVVYMPTDPYNEDFFLAGEDLMDRLAERIVETMERDWGTF